MGHSVEPFSSAAGALANVHRKGVVATRANELGDELVRPNLLGQFRGVDAEESSRNRQRRFRALQRDGCQDGGYKSCVQPIYLSLYFPSHRYEEASVEPFRP